VRPIPPPAVAGHVSKGDFHWLSPKPTAASEPINGTINTPVGCTIPELTNALNDDPTFILV
jgi:hypothetical protein